MTGMWGPWRLNREDQEVTLDWHDPAASGYYVILDECRTCAEVLDWIAQVSSKTWATPAIVGHLVEALDQLLELQANYCTGGVDQGRQNPRQLVQKSRPAVT